MHFSQDDCDYRIDLLHREVRAGLRLLRTIVVTLFLGAAGIISTAALLRGLDKLREFIKLDSIDATLLFFLLTVFFYTLLSKSKKISEINSLISRVELSIYRMCINYALEKVDHWRCWAAPDFVKRKLPNHQSQNDISNIISKEILEEEGPKFGSIIGPSASGKTQCALYIIEKLLLKECNNLSKFDFYIYDLISPSTNKELKKSFAKHSSKSVVIVDNLHNANSNIVNFLTEYIEKGLIRERYILFLSQDVSSWVINPSKNVELFDLCKKKSSEYFIDELPTRNLSSLVLEDSFLDDIQKTNMRSLRVTQNMIVASSMNGHSDSPTIITLRNILLDKSSDQKGNKLFTEFLATVVALSIHRAGFNAKDFIRIIWLNGKSQMAFFRLMRVKKAVTWLREMTKKSILPMVVTAEKKHILHDELAKEWKDKLYKKHGFFYTYFNNAVQLQIKEFSLPEAIKWLLSVEIRDDRNIVNEIDTALKTTNINLMVKSIERNQEVLENLRVLYKYGMLLNKSGKFEEAKRHLLPSISNLDESSDEFLQYAITRIEAEHGKEAELLLAKISKTDNNYYQLCGKYWDLHIRAHKGSFDSNALKGLLDSTFKILTSRNKSLSYDELYFLSRLVFDGCRHVFLEKKNAATDIEFFVTHKACEYLKKEESQYLANMCLYSKAHLLAHDIIPRYFIFSESLESIKASHHFYQSLDVKQDKESILKECLDLYSEASRLFSAVGGRESLYLKIDILNIEILSETRNAEDIYQSIQEYKKFIFDSGFEELFSYPFFYMSRLSIYQYYQAFVSGNDMAISTHAENSLSNIEKAIEYDKSYGNAYGVWRGQLYRFLIETFIVKKPQVSYISSLEHFRSQAHQLGFYRDIEFIDSLINEGNNPTLHYIKKFFLYYPFVHQ